MSRVAEPYDIIAEELLLGAILHEPTWYFEIPASAEHFWHPAAQATWIALADVFKNIDSLPTRAELVSRLRARLRETGGDHDILKTHQLAPDEYLAMMLSRIVSRSDLTTSWEKVERHHKQRATIEECRRYAVEAAQHDVDVEHVAAGFQERFSSILAGRKLEYFTPAMIMSESMERAAVMRETGVDTTRTPTGLRVVDDLLGGGLGLGHYTVLAAKRKMGKSRLTLAMAFEMAINSDRWAVDYYSIEETPESVGDLANSWYLGKPKRDLAKPELFDADKFRAHVDNARDLKADMRLFFGPQHTADDIVRNTMARAASTERPLAVFVDYLQEVDVPGLHNEYDRVTYTTRALARMSRRYKCAVVAAAQFNRASGSGEPAVHQLRSSGQIEQDVNELFILHRSAEEEKNATREQKEIGTLRLALNRHGPTDVITMRCKMATLQFADMIDSEPF